MSRVRPLPAQSFVGRPLGYLPGMADHVAVLRGGSRDGESTVVHEGVDRLLAVSDAPGLLDVYEANGETAHVDGNPDDALVFVHAGQMSDDGIAPNTLHAQPLPMLPE